MRPVFFSLLILMATGVSHAGSPIQNMIDVPVPIRADGSGYAIDEVRTAIIKGCQARRWTAEIAGDGLIRARLNVRNKHFAVVEIPYSASSYSIIYVSSENLDYKPKRETIHRNYNKWVLNLSATINSQFLNLARAKSAAAPARAETEDMFDQLLKLDELRDAGVLTDEEFEEEKRKLLDRR